MNTRSPLQFWHQSQSTDNLHEVAESASVQVVATEAVVVVAVVVVAVVVAVYHLPYHEEAS